MTPIEIIRSNIDDDTQTGISYETGTGQTVVYQLDHKNVFNLAVYANSTLVPSSGYVLNSKSGQVTEQQAEGVELRFEYSFAGFTDAELTSLLSAAGDDTDKATLAAIDILLVSAAKRFDYKSGQKDFKVSQVFENLQKLRENYIGKIAEAAEAGTGGVRVLQRGNKYYRGTRRIENDLSRKDIG